MSDEFKFEQEWDEDTDIGWWRASRKQLNKVIRAFNEWQIEGKSLAAARPLLARIEHGRQTYGAQDGGSGYLEVLDRMHAYVLRSHPELENGVYVGPDNDGEVD